MTTLKIGIASYEDFKARTIAIARGDLKPTADEPKVWFPSTESFARVLSQKNCAPADSPAARTSGSSSLAAYPWPRPASRNQPSP